MMSVTLSADLIGMAAGALVSTSSLPKIGERVRKLSAGEAVFNLPDLCRDLLQGVGNGLWVYVGVSAQLVSVTVFCGLNGLLMITLVLLNLRSGRRR